MHRSLSIDINLFIGISLKVSILDNVKRPLNACIIHHAVQLWVLVGNLAHESRNTLRSSNIEYVKTCRSVFFAGFFELRLGATGYEDRLPLADEVLGDGLSDATRPACDESAIEVD